jgi:hypothetical protein
MLYRVVLSYACYGVWVENGVIVDAAPIARWAIGKSISYFEGWVRKKGGTIESLDSG